VAPPVFPFPEYVQKLGCFNGSRDPTLGLTPLGVQVVERMLELGILIDITHCTPAARKNVFDIVRTNAPLLASHVGSYEVNPNPYNLEDYEVRRIAETGGVVGVIFMNYWLAPHARRRGIDFISQTIRHFVSVAGEDHVAIGSDFDGFTDPPDDLEDASKLPFLTQRLLSDGFTPDQIAKILGGNALRIIRESWGTSHA
jgi:membrane dipeptidase